MKIYDVTEEIENQLAQDIYDAANIYLKSARKIKAPFEDVQRAVDIRNWAENVLKG